MNVPAPIIYGLLLLFALGYAWVKFWDSVYRSKVDHLMKSNELTDGWYQSQEKIQGSVVTYTLCVFMGRVLALTMCSEDKDDICRIHSSHIGNKPEESFPRMRWEKMK